MTHYIPRRIAVVNELSEVVEFSDIAFFSIDGPLILLGEPGVGKSYLLKLASEQLGARIYAASTIEALSAFDEDSDSILVDGVDEITAYGSGIPINKILPKLSSDKRIIVACRAADWQNEINTAIVTQKWHHRPTVGQVLPFNDQEIIDFVDAHDYSQPGYSFIEEARRHDVIDLLRNPQNLLLYLEAIKNNGWPTTRTEIYEQASSELVKENNPIHGSINTTRPSQEQLLSTAGFIFAQLLLAGKGAIARSYESKKDYPEASELTSDTVDINLIESALSTGLFRPSGASILEPCHRTVAEFLAAKWIANALKEKLSLRRLESILYGNNYIVPTALRGLHAWIATFSSGPATRFIERDPYGVFRYGDLDALTIAQSKRLLKSLEKIAEADPYFRSKDWHATFSKGLSRPELKVDLIQLIRNPQTPPHLSHLLIESLQGDSFADEIADALLDLVIDASADEIERQAAFEAISNRGKQLDWLKLMRVLRSLSDENSLRVAFNLIQDKVELFDGSALAQTYIELVSATSLSGSGRYCGTKFELEKKLSTIQLEESLDVFAKLSGDETWGQDDRRYDLNHTFFKFMQERLERGPPPSTKTIMPWLQHSQRINDYQKEWEEYSKEYFSTNVQLRQDIQREVISVSKHGGDLRKRLIDLRAISRELSLKDVDLMLHLDELLQGQSSKTNYDKWKYLVEWGMECGIQGEFHDFARKQSSKHAELFLYFTELEKRLESNSENEEKDRERKNRQNKQKRRRGIQQSYVKIQEHLVSGEHLSGLRDIAKAYLGRFLDLKEINEPSKRVEALVGTKIVSVAFQGLANAIGRDNVPTARQIAEIHAKERKEFFYEPILLAHCAIMFESKSDQINLPIAVASSALAACHWGLDYNDDLTGNLEKKLESFVFSDAAVKESFVRDTMEPYLEHRADHVSGLYRLVRTEEFSDIAGKLAYEWINKYSNITSNNLSELLMAVIRYTSHESAANLIRLHLKEKKWRDEESRNLWMSAAFLLDFEGHIIELNEFAIETKGRLWSLREMAYPNRGKDDGWPKLSASQLYFIITRFGPLWPLTDYPSGVSRGNDNPWDASEFISGQISRLAAILSDEAADHLRKVVKAEDLTSYHNIAKHLFAQQIRNIAESKKALLSVEGVKRILLKGEPADHDDLQALLIDELDALQNRTRNGTTNDILPYWNGQSPHDENYCRDRIMSAMNSYLERYTIRSHIEGAMPNNNRCDILNTHKLLNVPIEVKGQWHSDVWTAAEIQLQNYSSEYHSDGHGIYLVLWFGYLGPGHAKNPHGWQGQPLPKCLDEMQELLKVRFGAISDKTKIFVFDLSKNSNVS